MNINIIIFICVYSCLSVVSLILFFTRRSVWRAYFLFPISYFQLKGFGHLDILSANSIKARATGVSAYFS